MYDSRLMGIVRAGGLPLLRRLRFGMAWGAKGFSRVLRPMRE